MDSTDSVPMTARETQELLATFGAMAPLLTKHSQRPKEDERDTKKVKTQHRPQVEELKADLPQVVMHMAKLLIRPDAAQNLLRKQDSFVFYMQMEPESVIHTLSSRAKSWHHEMSQESQMKTQEWKPLRVTLMQTLAVTMQQRFQKLYDCKPTDQLYQTAMQHKLLNAQGEFFFQRWDSASQQLTQTDQPPVAMERMRRYMDQLVENTMDPNNVLKFHSLKASGEQAVTPWILQISLRCDELQVLLETLSGNKVWNLLGAALKPHTLSQSTQAQQLKTMLGKGKSAGKGKAPKK
jgi:hypothetical protein